MPDDVRDAFRRWRRRPGFPLAATLTLGLGIGAATAMFSVVDAVLLRPLPWPHADRLAVIHAVYPERRTDPRFASSWNRAPVHRTAWEALRRASSFEDVAVWMPPSLSMTIDEGRTELAQTMQVSSNFLPMLGVKVIHGRHFDRKDDDEDTYHLILTYKAWLRWFGGRPEVVGKPSSIADASDTHTPPWVIIGVLEPGFTFDGLEPEVLLTIGGNARSQRMFTSGDYRTVARLSPGASLKVATAEADALMQASQSASPIDARVVLLHEDQVGPAARALWVLFGAASVLLLIACANVAGLLLGENRARRHETAIRLALGMTRGGIVRQLIAEHAMLAVAGAAAGLVLAGWLTQGLVALAPLELPRLDTVQVNWRVAGFALGAGFVTLVTFGLGPALSLARTHAGEMLAEGGRSASATGYSTQRIVVAAEIAMSAVLVVGAGLLGETLFRLTSQRLGFDPSNIVVINTRFTGSNRPADWISGTRGQPNLNSGPPLAQRMAAIRRARASAVIERLQALPGVVHAAGISGTLLTQQPAVAGSRIVIDGRSADVEDRAAFRFVSGRFAETMRISVLSGRDLAEADGPTAALVSREFEKRYFPDGAIGRRFTHVPTPQLTSVYEVVGVVADVRHSYTEEALPRVYANGSTESFVLRTTGDPGMVVSAVRQALAQVNRQIVVTSTTTMEAALADVIAAERFRAMLSTAFAATALLLAVVGLYAIAARRVAERGRELGIRVALGARPHDLRALVLGDGMLTAAIGLAVGLPAAFAASQITRAFLHGVSPTAPHVFLLASVALGAAALAATFLPAQRASRIDPMLALRE